MKRAVRGMPSSSRHAVRGTSPESAKLEHDTIGNLLPHTGLPPRGLFSLIGIFENLEYLLHGPLGAGNPPKRGNYFF